MTIEKDPQGSEERSLVTRSTGNTDITTPESRSMLETMKFSPQFPARLSTLNDAFTNLAPVLRGVSIRLTPGRVPRIDTDLHYVNNGYVIEIDSDKNGDAKLKIKTPNNYMPMWPVTMERIQAFLADAVPNREAYLRAMPHKNVREKVRPLNIPVSSITPDIVEELDKEHTTEDFEGTASKHVPYDRDSFKVHLDRQDSPLLSLVLTHYYPKMRDAQDRRIGFLVSEMNYEGKTAEVETTMEKVVVHFMHPLDRGSDVKTQEQVGDLS